MSYRTCVDCSAPIDDGDRCSTCRNDGRALGPDPYLVAGGLDLAESETTLAYRQSKFRRS